MICRMQGPGLDLTALMGMMDMMGHYYWGLLGTTGDYWVPWVVPLV